MKRIFYSIIILIVVTIANVNSQTIYKHYYDGELYVKIKNSVPFDFDTTKRDVDINSKLPFLIAYIEKYNINKVHATFYFAKSEVLKRTFRIYFDRIEKIDRFIDDLKRLTQVEYAEKIPVMRYHFKPNDMGGNGVSFQWSLHKIHAKEAWDVTRGSASVHIAIIDNAVDTGHPDLLISNWWDVADNDADPSPPFPYASPWEHGTLCAGMASAKTNNGKGIAAIGFGCGLTFVKATPDTSTSGAANYGYEGITWAATGAVGDIISCSWGGPGFSATNQAVIDYAYSQNRIVVSAAGNNYFNMIQYPSGYNHVLSVASTDFFDVKAQTSNYGTWVDVAAPGESIRTTTLSFFGMSDYKVANGTSIACPLVAGLCGLIKSLNGSLSNDDIVNCILNNTDNIDAQNPGYIGQLGSGRINAYRAVECALPCNGSVNLGSGVYTLLKTESSGSITSANNIPSNAQVTLDAASSIVLQPNFIANNGCIFRAYIDGCAGAKMANPNLSESAELKNKDGNLSVFPNPFTDRTTIEYFLSDEKQVDLKIYNLQMQLVKTLISASSQKGGKHSVEFNADDLSNGIYICKLQTGNETFTRKLVLTK